MIRRPTRVLHYGGSDVVVIPKALVKGEWATLAADRLMLVDPRGEISEVRLGEILERVVEPELYARPAVVPARTGTRGKAAGGGHA